MALSLTNSKEKENSYKKNEEIAQNTENISGISNLIPHENNPFKELDSLPESLALLQCLCSFDSTKEFKEENKPISDYDLTRILNLATTVSEENDCEPTIVNLREYFESPTTSIVTNEIREESILPSNNQEPSQGNLPALVSLAPSPRSLTYTKSQEPLITINNVEIDDFPREKTRNIEPNNDLCNPDLVIDAGRKNSDTEEDVDGLARELDIWGPPDEDEERIFNSTADQQDSGPSTPALSPGLVSDARLAGIHAAAALFRRPSAASKKYTRAPISKIFISLDITAEMFLKLQGAAKVYMLDEKFPDRRKAIGAKSRSEKDLNKLKLYSVVKHFLEEEGWGEHCFGCQSEGADQRKFKWPDSKNKIIKLVTPLMRRMVTNERQRRYANETRMEKRLGSGNKRGTTNKSTVPSNKSAEPEITVISISPVEPEITTTSISPLESEIRTTSISPVEPEIISVSSENSNIQNGDDGFHLQTIPDSSIDANFNAIIEYIASSSNTNLRNENKMSDTAHTDQIPTLEKAFMKYYINLLRDGCRIKERLEIQPDQYLDFSKLIHHVNQSIDYRQEQILNIKVHGPDGLIKVFDEDSWSQAVLLIFKHQWMDQEVRCLINLENTS
ncbi:hypothetical protein OnM2_016071 [Erysiphe neolycopersici]|uniref:Uncharacterized protein n=1 Tax=Erysiphe neolycopersici TaxID=212602 RepID=A0A420I4W9_9PEZI|nr:hypothetical protein OnM2_016071 [Erysiphe neolycopersici]